MNNSFSPKWFPPMFRMIVDSLKLTQVNKDLRKENMRGFYVLIRCIWTLLNHIANKHKLLL